MYVSDEFLVSVLPPPPPPLEILTLSVLSVNFKLHLCLFYRPPSSTCGIFDNLCTYLQSINAGHLSNFLFLGDFSTNYDNPSHPLYSNLCSITSLYCLTQVVVGPTHVHHDGSTSTIDLVFVSDPSMVNSCNTIPPLSNSDHYGIVMELNRKPEKPEKSKGRLIWRYSYADWNTARELIDTYNWDSIMSDDIELSWKQWHQQFMSIMSQTIPNRLLPSRRNLPCIVKQIYIVRSMKKRNLLFKRANELETLANSNLPGIVLSLCFAVPSRIIFANLTLRTQRSFGKPSSSRTRTSNQFQPCLMMA